MTIESSKFGDALRRDASLERSWLHLCSLSFRSAPLLSSPLLSVLFCSVLFRPFESSVSSPLSPLSSPLPSTLDSICRRYLPKNASRLCCVALRPCRRTQHTTLLYCTVLYCMYNTYEVRGSIYCSMWPDLCSTCAVRVRLPAVVCSSQFTRIRMTRCSLEPRQSSRPRRNSVHVYRSS